LDQAISLFGKPLKFHKTLGKHRANTKVDDYFAIHLSYPNDLNVFLTSSMLVPEIPPAFMVHGMMGSFIKNHADVQEEQLLSGMKPTDSKYGIENPADAGKLTLVSEGGGRTSEQVLSKKGDYNGIFEAVYQAITSEVPYPITETDILTQLEILEQ
jgi:hypothetical protein